MEDLCESGAEEGLRGERGNDVEKIYNGGGQVLLLAKQRKEGCEVCCWCGLGVLFLEGRLDRL